MKFETSINPWCWTFAEYELGKRVTKDMVTFATDRPDIQVNEYGVVLFARRDLAEQLLKDFKQGEKV